MMIVEALAGGVLAALLLAWIVNQPDGFGFGRSTSAPEIDLASDVDDFEIIVWDWPQ